MCQSSFFHPTEYEASPGPANGYFFLLSFRDHQKNEQVSETENQLGHAYSLAQDLKREDPGLKHGAWYDSAHRSTDIYVEL
jgi:hypothetical protein